MDSNPKGEKNGEDAERNENAREDHQADAERRRPEGDANASENGDANGGDSPKGASPCNTHLSSSLDGDVYSERKAKFAIDWLEVSGLVRWDESVSTEKFNWLDGLKTAASELERPETLELAGRHGFIHGRGMGSGRQSHLEYRMEFAGATLGVSSRPAESRQLSNFYLKVPGETCLLFGALELRQFAVKVLRELGGQLTDEWIRRLDVCLDLPRYNLRRRLMPAFRRRCYVTSSKRTAMYREPSKYSGFSVNGGNVSLRVYDKLLEASQRGGAYLEAMVQRRWNGMIPPCATRVELQLRRGFFGQWQDDAADRMLENLAGVLQRVLRTENRPFFRLTEETPDRKNKHQSRAATHPEWMRIIKTFVTRAGDTRKSLVPIHRGNIDCERGYRVVRGYIVSIAAMLGWPIDSVDDAVELLRRMNDGFGVTDAEWRHLWQLKARKHGTLDGLDEFPFGTAA